MVLSEIFIFYFLFFRRQGFRMIIFDRQAGPLQNFNRSHVMVIGRSVSFSDPKAPQNPPLPKKIVHAFQNPRNIFEKKISRGKNFFFFFAVTKNFHPPPPPPLTPTPNIIWYLAFQV